MCGRYTYGTGTIEGVKRMTGEDLSYLDLRPGTDICPSMDSLTVKGLDGRLMPGMMNWGFPLQGSKQLVFNARSETALEKRMFKDCIMRRRCIIPAQHFYEWDRDKNKATFSLEDESILLMLGFYEQIAGMERFVILTTNANESMIQTHDRMPLIIDEKRAADWVFDDGAVKHFLTAGSPLLRKHQEYEQLRFF